jgi:hypothetical protein
VGSPQALARMGESEDGRSVDVQVIYFDGCPSRRPHGSGWFRALALVRVAGTQVALQDLASDAEALPSSFAGVVA